MIAVQGIQISLVWQWGSQLGSEPRHSRHAPFATWDARASSGLQASVQLCPCRVVDSVWWVSHSHCALLKACFECLLLLFWGSFRRWDAGVTFPYSRVFREMATPVVLVHTPCTIRQAVNRGTYCFPEDQLSCRQDLKTFPGVSLCWFRCVTAFLEQTCLSDPPASHVGLALPHPFQR